MISITGLAKLSAAAVCLTEANRDCLCGWRKWALSGGGCEEDTEWAQCSNGHSLAQFKQNVSTDTVRWSEAAGHTVLASKDNSDLQSQGHMTDEGNLYYVH